MTHPMCASITEHGDYAYVLNRMCVGFLLISKSVARTSARYLKKNVVAL